jgi:predicted O-linked N-acetylglucosamine transferase (SPINDLY family)
MQPEKAIEFYEKGRKQQQLGNLQAAEKAYRRSIKANPNFGEAHNNLGNVLLASEKYLLALESYQKAEKFFPDHPMILSNIGNVLQKTGQNKEAVRYLERATNIAPDYAEAYCNLGNAFKQLGKASEALEAYNRAIATNPQLSESYSNKGALLLELHDPENAKTCLETAIKLKPKNADAYNNLGSVFLELQNHEEAKKCLMISSQINPNSTDCLINLSRLFLDQLELENAKRCIEKAIRLRPSSAEVYASYGHIQLRSKQIGEAIVNFDKALSLNPIHKFLLGDKIYSQMKICEWKNLGTDTRKLTDGITSEEILVNPFQILSLVDDPSLHRTAAKNFADSQFSADRHPLPPNKKNSQEKIKLGYFSSDFRNHAVGQIILGLFKAHDRSKFEVYGFSFGPNIDDEITKKLRPTFDDFFDVRKMSDLAAAEFSRRIGIDIAIDLNGYTEHSRPAIFVHRAAPVQASYLGYPGTMSMSCIDYIIADKVVVSDETQGQFTEKIIYLPNSYQVNDANREISSEKFSRSELGLPEEGFVFCCFNNNHKILPDTFDTWMRILRTVEGSVLWLAGGAPAMENNLREQAERRDVNSNRIIFAKHLPLNEHLARHSIADLFLDTAPYNAHATASHSLWAGVPVLTCLGKSFPSRVAASLLYALELPELVTKTTEEFAVKAIDLGSDAGKLHAIRKKLEQNKKNKPLFDVSRFAKHLEAAYEQAHQQHQNGLPATTITIEDL